MFIYIDFIKMRISIRNFSLLLIVLVTTGCSMIEKSVSSISNLSSVSSPNSSERLCANDEGEFYKCEDAMHIVKKEETRKTRDTKLFRPSTNFQTINEYTEQMAYVLSQNISLKNIEKSIAVPPFISVPYSKSGNQQLNVSVAEAIVVSMQNIGLPVAEFILTNSSDEKQINFISYIEELAESQHFGYVLKGTIGEKIHGTMIHAKIIDLETKEVIASTSKFLPKYLVSLLN
jgi:TolB-like protein